MRGRGEGSKGLAMALVFLALYAALYVYYLVPQVNSPDPVLLGVSRALAYAIILWAAMMLAVVAAYLYVWR